MPMMSGAGEPPNSASSGSLRAAWMVGASAWLIATLIFNLQTSRQAYVERVDGGNRGGVRMGFPFQLWDAGHLSVIREGRWTMKPYGGWQYGGFALNLLVLGVGALSAGAAGAFAARKLGLCDPGPAPAPDLPRSEPAAITPHACMAMGGAAVLLLLVNIQVRTEQVAGAPYLATFEHECGWPLTMWRGRDRFVRQAADEPMPQLAEVVDASEYQQDFALRNSVGLKLDHWIQPALVANLLFGAFLVLAAGNAGEWWRRRRNGRSPDRG
ncbi:MAG: hypothetical protein M5U26_16225 [Planctomycetota bacterium]|nr:hypothetical protein [Planctomycetota bacterium]